MKKLLCLAVPFVLFAAQKQTLSVDECNKIFEQRKAEIAYQIETLEEKEQSLSAFQNANKNVQTQKEQKLSQKLAEINKLLAEVAKKEQNTKAMLDENKKVLDAIQKAKDDKITQSYVKMKPGPAAGILSVQARHPRRPGGPQRAGRIAPGAPLRARPPLRRPGQADRGRGGEAASAGPAGGHGLPPGPASERSFSGGGRPAVDRRGEPRRRACPARRASGQGGVERRLGAARAGGRGWLPVGKKPAFSA